MTVFCGQAFRRQGALGPAIDCLSTAAESSGRLGADFITALAWSELGPAHLAAGRASDARATAVALLDLGGRKGALHFVRSAENLLTAIDSAEPFGRILR